jgi:ribokinase
VALIVVETGGENLITVAPGANACLSAADVDAARHRLARADVVVAQLEVPLETVAAAGSAARRSGVPFVLNAAPAQVLPADLLGEVDVLILNESELGALAGQTVPEGDEVDAARRLLETGPAAVVVTLGGRGVLVVDSHGVTSVPALRVVAVDTTAAGDAFVGALAARYRGPDSLVATCRFAAAAGALACTRPAAQPSLPKLAEVERLLASS